MIVHHWSDVTILCGSQGGHDLRSHHAEIASSPLSEFYSFRDGLERSNKEFQSTVLCKNARQVPVWIVFLMLCPVVYSDAVSPSK